MYLVIVIRSTHSELCHEMLRLIACVEGVAKAALVEKMHQSALRFVENASGVVVHPSAGGGSCGLLRAYASGITAQRFPKLYIEGIGCMAAHAG